MPIKWSADKDHLLLLKIIETHNIKLDTNKVAEAWPGDEGERPTPRAIKERLFKLRQMSGNESAKTQTKPSSVPVTPRKPTTPKSAVSASSTNKRKHVSIAEPVIKPDPDVATREDGILLESDSSPLDGHSSLSRSIKTELENITLNDLEAVEYDTPSKRVRKQIKRPNMADYNGETSDDDKAHRVVSSSGSEFMPDDSSTIVDQENVDEKAETDEAIKEEVNYYA